MKIWNIGIRQRRWLIIGGALVVLLLAFVAFSVLVFSIGGLGGPTRNMTPEQAAALARVTLPPSAHNVEYIDGGFQDRFIHLRFDMDAAELDSFLRGTFVAPPLTDTDVPFQASLEPDESWWQPRNASTFKSGGGSRNGVYQSLLVDMTNAQTYVVYVATFES